MAVVQAPVMQTRTSDSNLDFKTLLMEHLSGGYQFMYVPTAEEHRVEREIEAAAKEKKLRVVYWDHFDGFQGDKDFKLNDQDAKIGREPAGAPQLLGLSAPLVDVGKKPKNDPLPNNTIYVLRDIDDYFQSPPIRRAIRSLAVEQRLVCGERFRPVIILSPKLDIHQKLRSHITVLDFALPDEAKLLECVKFIQASVAETAPDKATLSDEYARALARTLLGLTATEAENALARGIARYKEFHPDLIRMLQDEKAGIVKKSEVLTYIDASQLTKREHIGGYDTLISFVRRRKNAYSTRATELRIDNPKGMVLIGVPGTGKSVVATTVAGELDLPLYTMDVGAIFGSLVGESEARMRDALRQITAQQGCVLLIDEADKAWGNAHSSSGDSGVTQRVFGQLLSWLAAKQDRTFVIMTMNRTDGIPPEFLRAGRFDKIFFTDLPNPTERRAIYEIHLRKRGVDPNLLALSESDWDALCDASNEFVGSEIEIAVVEARLQAFEERNAGVPTFTELLTQTKAIIPLMKLDKAGVDKIREFCKERATSVSAPESKAERRARQGRRIDTSSNPAGAN
jgi:SpoVK/Ycf46/Vps4 family AAA+-type ATPase